MPTLHVCPLSRVAETAEAIRASHLVTLMTDGAPVIRPDCVAPEHHLQIAVSDIVIARDGYVLPGDTHVRALLDFVRAWDRQRPLLLHCYAGISRSTAAVFIAACALSPGIGEDDLADRLRLASPSATPNSRLVAMADGLLGREGRMTRAITRIGRGEDAFEGTPFQMPFT